MTNPSIIIKKLTQEGGNLKDNLTYKDLIDLETALNQAKEQLPKGHEQDDEIRVEWKKLTGRSRLYSCFMAEVERLKEDRKAEAEQIEQIATPNSSKVSAFIGKIISSNPQNYLKDTISGIIGELNNKHNSKNCQNCITLLTKIEEIEKRLNKLEGRDELIAQIEQR